MIGTEVAIGGLLRIRDYSILSTKWPTAINKALMNLVMKKIMFFYVRSFNQMSKLNLFQSVICRVAAYLNQSLNLTGRMMRFFGRAVQA